jgi:hypothetical protein
MTNSLVITADGEVWREYLDGYQPLSQAVGGMIECVPSSDKVTIWCNEEGKLQQLNLNAIATGIWSELDTFRCIAAGDFLVGTIVIQGPIDDEGNSTDCPAWLLHEFGVLGE